MTPSDVRAPVGDNTITDRTHAVDAALSENEEVGFTRQHAYPALDVVGLSLVEDPVLVQQGGAHRVF